ncbi:hypothetical protein [Mesorhizobium sp. M1322]|uniref:hypothetical protein n=1 Tax=Mesorhizobium sp. M1322 TaxID=2957081 RepID=UPI00333D2157
MANSSEPFRYVTPDDPYGLTGAQLGKTMKREQRRYMLAWFWRYYDHPNDTSLTYGGGDYRFDAQPPFTAEGHLTEEFSQFVPYRHIKEVVDALKSDNPPDWARRETEFDATQSHFPATEERLGAVVQKLESGVQPHFGSDDERALRALIEEELKGLEIHLKWPSSPFPSHGGQGHNNPPPDYELEDQLDEAQKAVSDISEELPKTAPDASRLSKATKVLMGVGKFVSLAVAAKLVEVGAETAYSSISDYLQMALAYITPLVERIVDWLELIIS